ncbi:hypothetical protein ACWD3I_36085 [Streptomyces sp. NPDC002817]|uniref:hypothetical protein n=1 Tax=Streptomyces sp. NPDC088357 TaxID=3154655 RepID=UPI003449827C
MTRRTRKLFVTGAVLAAAGLTGGGVALAVGEGDEPSRDRVRFVVTENDHDCPEKSTGTDTPASEL